MKYHQPNFPQVRLCQVQHDSTRECLREVPPDYPLAVCEVHAAIAADMLLSHGGSAADKLRALYALELPPPSGPSAPVYVAGAPAVVYYLQFGAKVKIGTSRSLQSRLAQIPHDHLVAVEPGHYDVERRRHFQFSELRLDGEWFSLDADLRDHIDNLRAMYGDPHHAYQAWVAQAA